MLKGKTVLITGASRGIGKGIAIKFAQHGAFVGINYVNNDSEAEKTLNLVKEKGGDGILLKADVSKKEDVEKIVKKLFDKKGQIDILVNNAGIYFRNNFEKLPFETWNQVLSVNLTGCYHLCKSTLPYMKKNSRIIFISSQLAFKGSSHGSDYATTKAGMIGLMRSLALELSDKKILVNAVAPGTIDTDIISHYTKGQRQKRINEIPLKRMGEPVDIANACLFLVGYTFIKKTIKGIKNMILETNHKIINKNSNKMNELKNDSIDLIITSPPYPMIQMWDSLFSNINKKINEKLNDEDGKGAFELMHLELDKTWKETTRVAKPGGIICINIGDATRKINNNFQVFSNHARIIDFFKKNNYTILPDILWHKPSNKPNKFMGSGMLPTNAYATLEHEYILLFRKGKNRIFTKQEKKQRYHSAYFWEERNQWFSDIWTGIRGIGQNIKKYDQRNRSAAFPFDLPYRIINMYSIQKDMILDPFWGTGTTSYAAMASARNSIGYEIDKNLIQLFKQNIKNIKKVTYERNLQRIKNHIEFIKNRETKYKSEQYDFNIITKQETKIMLYDIDKIKKDEQEKKIVIKHLKHQQ